MSQMLIDIIGNNPHLKINPYLQKAIFFVDQLIPENCKRLFYDNLSTLTIKSNINLKSNGTYSSWENKLEINERVITKTLSRFKITSEEEISKYIVETFVHELLHMASFDKGTNKIGFEEADATGKEFNEGVTQFLCAIYTKNKIFINNYEDLTDAAEAIANIVGIDFLKENYFTASGLENINRELMKYEKVPNQSKYLIEDIINYYKIMRVVMAPFMSEKLDESFYEDTEGFDLDAAPEILEKDIANTLYDLLETRIRNDIKEGNINSTEEYEAKFKILLKQSIATDSTDNVWLFKNEMAELLKEQKNMKI